MVKLIVVIVEWVSWTTVESGVVFVIAGWSKRTAESFLAGFPADWEEIIQSRATAEFNVWVLDLRYHIYILVFHFIIRPPVLFLGVRNDSLNNGECSGNDNAVFYLSGGWWLWLGG